MLELRGISKTYNPGTVRELALLRGFSLNANCQFGCCG